MTEAAATCSVPITGPDGQFEPSRFSKWCREDCKGIRAGACDKWPITSKCRINEMSARSMRTVEKDLGIKTYELQRRHLISEASKKIKLLYIWKKMFGKIERTGQNSIVCSDDEVFTMQPSAIRGMIECMPGYINNGYVQVQLRAMVKLARRYTKS